MLPLTTASNLLASSNLSASSSAPSPSAPSSSSSLFPPTYPRPGDDYTSPFTPKPTALWVPDTGLVVSPNMLHVPAMARAHHRGYPDYSKPALLSDSDIYMAFRPIQVSNSGDLFGRLDTTRDEISREICAMRNKNFILSTRVSESWQRLETNMIDACKTLLSSPGLPTITYPKLPWECGYGTPHDTKEKTINCVLHSRNTFVDLSALLSFGLALHMGENGSLEPAFRKLTERRINPVNQTWIAKLADSYICDFSKNFRVGGAFNPYQSHWLRHLHKLTQANVPLWILWGHEYQTIRPLDDCALKFLPPHDVIEDAKRRAQFTTTVILPIMRYDPFQDNPAFSTSGFDDVDDSMGQYDLPDSSEPVPHASSSALAHINSFAHSTTELSSTVQLASSSTSIHKSIPSADTIEKTALAELMKFFEEVQRSREKYLATEPAHLRQSRLSREQHALTHQHNKSSTVYIWRDVGDGSYVREKVNSKQVGVEWPDFTRNQCRYTGHRNEWDLCPQLPRYSEENLQSEEPYNSDDDDSDSSYILPVGREKTTLQTPSGQEPSSTATAMHVLQAPAAVAGPSVMVELSEEDRLTASHVETVDFVSFFKDRFGYDVYSPSNWHRSLHTRQTNERVPVGKALIGLSVLNAPGGPVISDAVCNLVYILANTTNTFRDLPDSFDHTPNHLAPVSLASDTLAVTLARRKDGKLYLVHKRGSLNGSPWMIATSDPSTVLLIFRKKWAAVEVIARELVRRGIPFNTVAALELDAPVLLTPPPMTGFGCRPKNFKPTKDDYLEYLRARESLLKGPKGRAALLHGGIIARIAREVLDPTVVLDGPSSRENVIGHYDRFILVDDALTEQDLAVISGVYFVHHNDSPANTNASGSEIAKPKMTHYSWWPQDSTWIHFHPYLRMEWTEMAEDFYQKHLRVINAWDGSPLLPVGGWKAMLRKAKTLTEKIEHGVNHYQGGYVDHLLLQAHSADRR